MNKSHAPEQIVAITILRGAQRLTLMETTYSLFVLLGV